MQRQGEQPDVLDVTAIDWQKVKKEKKDKKDGDDQLKPERIWEADKAEVIRAKGTVHADNTQPQAEAEADVVVWDGGNNDLPFYQPDLHVVVQTAPSIRAAVGEGFGFAPGTPTTGKMVTALRLMGFDKVFDALDEIIKLIESRGT